MPDRGVEMVVLSTDVAGLVAHVVLGVIFVVHGWPKITDVRKTQAWVKGTGFPRGETFALLFTLLEFFGGIALIIGFLTQIVAALFVLEMIATAIFSKTKLNKKFVLGFELDIGYATLALVLVLIGPGAYSVDRLLNIF
jgi:putative oxidoreductase